MLLLLLRNQRGEHVIGGLHNMVRKSVEWVDLCNVRESTRTAPDSRKHVSGHFNTSRVWLEGIHWFAITC